MTMHWLWLTWVHHHHHCPKKSSKLWWAGSFSSLQCFWASNTDHMLSEEWLWVGCIHEAHVSYHTKSGFITTIGWELIKTTSIRWELIKTYFCTNRDIYKNWDTGPRSPDWPSHVSLPAIYSLVGCQLIKTSLQMYRRDIDKERINFLHLDFKQTIWYY